MKTVKELSAEVKKLKDEVKGVYTKLTVANSEAFTLGEQNSRLGLALEDSRSDASDLARRLDNVVHQNKEVMTIAEGQHVELQERREVIEELLASRRNVTNSLIREKGRLLAEAARIQADILQLDERLMMFGIDPQE